MVTLIDSIEETKEIIQSLEADFEEGVEVSDTNRTFLFKFFYAQQESLASAKH